MKAESLRFSLIDQFFILLNAAFYFLNTIYPFLGVWIMSARNPGDMGILRIYLFIYLFIIFTFDALIILYKGILKTEIELKTALRVNRLTAQIVII